MKNCKEISELLSESMERQLTWRERWAVRLHFMMCKACPRFLDQIQFLGRSAKMYKPKIKG